MSRSPRPAGSRPTAWPWADPALLDAVASSPELLVATDYDGTLADVVDDPSRAFPNKHAIVALRALSELPRTEVAVISGRSLDQLARFLGGGLERAHLVGSHGSEFDPGFVDRLTAEQKDRLALAGRIVAKVSERTRGSSVERKPASVCFHYRGSDAVEGAEAAGKIEAEALQTSGIFVKRGKRVVELGVVESNKGAALSVLRARLTPSRCVFLGDDRTDEDAFRSLEEHDVGVKVGWEDSAAGWAVADPGEVARFLAALAEARAAWLHGGGDPIPIERHAMLSNRRTIALVEPDATISWMCAPRIDSPSLFGKLLGGPRSGMWSVGPLSGSREPRQYYRDRTMTLVTDFAGVRVTDCLDCSDLGSGHHAGRLGLIRRIEAARPVRVDFVPRLNFGRTPTQLVADGRGLRIAGSHDVVLLEAPGVRWEIVRCGKHQSAHAVLPPDESPWVMELRFGPAGIPDGGPVAGDRARATEADWAGWAGRLRLPGIHRDAVLRSALTLRALIYEPTGAIAAAGTTSLPEWIGGVRNWDYRYCWPRDATMAAASLVRLGSTREAHSLLAWIGRVLERIASPESLAPLYTVHGDDVPQEAVVEELAGYAGSRPVRIGNAAATQIQLDVFAPVVELIGMAAADSGRVPAWQLGLVRDVAEAVVRRWREPDHGIWEPRTPPRHNTHTKVMCWVTLDRAIQIARACGEHESFGRFVSVRSEVREEILQRGWKESIGAFSASYESAELDAATLAIGLSGMLDCRDDRYVRTVDRIEAGLRSGAAVYRYFHEDGLPGDEGGFNLCTAWLIQALARTGRVERARELLERYVGLMGPTGLMSEEYDPGSGTSLGNYPQAYSHLGLIDSVLCLEGDLTGRQTGLPSLSPIGRNR